MIISLCSNLLTLEIFNLIFTIIMIDFMIDKIDASFDLPTVYLILYHVDCSILHCSSGKTISGKFALKSRSLR